MISIDRITSSLRSLRLLPLLLLVLAPVAQAGERPVHFGVSLAYPRTIPAPNVQQSRQRVLYDSFAEVSLKVDSNGVVIGKDFSHPPDSAFISQFGPVIDSLTFEPGLIDGHPAAQNIPVHLRYSTRRRQCAFDFPVDTAMLIHDPDLYFHTFELNGFELPQIDYFPSYYYRVVPTDTPGVCSYTLAKISLDSTGSLTAVEAVGDGPASYARQVMTAAHWAAYSPMRIDGRAVNSEAFLVVTFLPGIAYPTDPIAGGGDSLSLPDRVRVRLYPDTVGLMMKPIAIDMGRGGVYKIASGQIREFDAAAASITVDTVGTARIIEVTGCGSRGYDQVAQLLTALRFVPAADFAGSAREWEGLLRIGYVDSTKIRIGYTWFPGPQFSGGR